MGTESTHTHSGSCTVEINIQQAAPALRWSLPPSTSLEPALLKSGYQATPLQFSQNDVSDGSASVAPHPPSLLVPGIQGPCIFLPSSGTGS